MPNLKNSGSPSRRYTKEILYSYGYRQDLDPSSLATPVVVEDRATPVVVEDRATPVVVQDRATPVVVEDRASAGINKRPAQPAHSAIAFKPHPSKVKLFLM